MTYSMTYRKSLSLLFLPALMVACGEPPAEEAAPAEEPAAEASPDQAALQERADYWETHYNMQHADMVAAVWRDDGWWLPADGAYHEGQAAIEAALEESMTDAPTIDLTPMETRVFGDVAASLGTYSVQPPEGADAMGFSGTYFNVLQRVDGEWKIVGSVANYDAERPEGWPWAEEVPEVPEEGGRNVDLVESFEAAWNAGDIPAVMDFYADDALVSFSDGPIHRGHDEIRADLEARMATGATLDLLSVGTIELDEEWTADGGWYRIDGPEGAGPIQSGWYINLLHQAPDGTGTVHWSVTNGRPAGGM